MWKGHIWERGKGCAYPETPGAEGGGCVYGLMSGSGQGVQAPNSYTAAWPVQQSPGAV